MKNILCAFIILIFVNHATAQDDTEFIQWIKANAHPIESLDAGAPSNDLHFLKDLFKNTRMVGLGEATHGTSEFARVKTRLVEYMVKEMGFTVVGLEASYGRCQYINDYVMNGKGTLDTASVIQGATQWLTTEMRDLIQWIRLYNEKAAPAKKVRFVGFDFNSNDATAFGVSTYYEKIWPGRHAAQDSLLQLAASVRRNSAAEISEQLTKEIEWLKEKKNECLQRSSVDEYNTALWNLEVLKAAATVSTPARPPLRDREYFMAQNVFHFYNSFPKSDRIILWAHNGHVSKDFLRGKEPSMGSYLKSELKDNYYSLGLEFDRGSFQAGDADDRTVQGWVEHTVPAAPDEYFSHYMVRAIDRNSLIDFSKTSKSPAVTDWLLHKELPVHRIGTTFSVKRPLSEYTMYLEMYHSFDGILFIPESSRSHPLPPMDIKRYKINP